jgi:hypothetical protein
MECGAPIAARFKQVTLPFSTPLSFLRFPVLWQESALRLPGLNIEKARQAAGEHLAVARLEAHCREVNPHGP